MAIAQRIREILSAARIRWWANPVEARLSAISRAAQYAFPTAEIGQMLNEIERGYSESAGGEAV
jgi:hypothetical protein